MKEPFLSTTPFKPFRKKPVMDWRFTIWNKTGVWYLWAEPGRVNEFPDWDSVRDLQSHTFTYDTLSPRYASKLCPYSNQCVVKLHCMVRFMNRGIPLTLVISGKGSLRGSLYLPEIGKSCNSEVIYLHSAVVNEIPCELSLLRRPFRRVLMLWK